MSIDYQLIIDGNHELNVDSAQLDQLDIHWNSDQSVHLIHEGKSYRATIKDIDLQQKLVIVELNGATHQVKIKDQLDQLIQRLGMKLAVKTASSDVFAPMPGLVLKTMVAVGDQVEAGQPLLILEAMKMENVLKSEGAGTIKSIEVSSGTSVEKGQLLIGIEPS